MKNNHLHMIECKARDDFEQTSVSDFIYKLDSVRTIIDEDANMVFLTQDSVYDPFMDGIITNPISPYNRANARRVFLRGSPIKQKERFLKDIDTIFALQTENIDELAPEEKLPITDATQQRNVINVHLQKLFELEIDFFNKTHLSKVLNFKVNYSQNKKVQQNMKKQEIKQLLRLINRLKETRDIQYLYNYFCKKFQTIR